MTHRGSKKIKLGGLVPPFLCLSGRSTLMGYTGVLGLP